MAEDHEPGAYLKATLASQPRELRRIIEDESANKAARRLQGCSRVFIVGTGTSYHGALAGQYMLRSAGVDAWAVRAFDFATYPPAIGPNEGLILLSHRGTKRYSRQALEVFASANDRWIVITGLGSPVEGHGVVRTVEQERSPVHTASHTAAMLRIAQLAAAIGDAPWQDEIAGIPDAVAWTIDEYAGKIASDAMELELQTLVHFVGGGPARATAYEGALKIREASHIISAEGHDLEGLLHGPLISLRRGQVVVLVTQHGLALERTVEVAKALSEIGTALILDGSAAGDVAGLDGVEARREYQTQPFHEALAPIVNVIPLQLLAYEAARKVGVDADSFRRDEKEYAAAQAEFTL